MSNAIIPAFPQFQKLDIAHRSNLLEIIQRFPAYSDFGFTSLLCWDTAEQMQISLLNGNLCVLFKDYESEDQFLTLLGQEAVSASLRTLLEYSRKHGYGDKLHLVPKVVVDRIEQPEDFVIKPDRDNFDYVLSAELLAKLEGSKNEDRRARIKKFLNKHGDRLDVRQLDLKVQEAKNAILECLSIWEALRPSAANPSERQAINRLLIFSQDLPVQALGFFIAGQVAGFSIFERIHNDFGVVHFEKGNLEYDGITAYIKHLTAKYLYDQGAQFINYEQDLGIEGLRKAKTMLHPVDFLEKYTISLAT